MKNSKKILVIDDNDSLRELLGYALSSFGYDVETASDGLFGLEKLEEDSFDLLITDNQMPRMGGLKLLEEITQREINIKTMMISGDLTREVVEGAKERGVFAFLKKPFSLNILRETISKVFMEEKTAKQEHDLHHSPQLLEAAAM